jgi:hypothetical protein
LIEAVLVAHPQEQLVVRIVVRRCEQRNDGLARELEAILFQGRLNAGYPAHLAVAPGYLYISLVVDVDAITATVLGGIAGGIRGAQDAGHGLSDPLYRHHADAHTDPEDLLLPGESEIFDRPAQRVGDTLRDVHGAVLQQDAELVAAQAREGVLAPHLLREYAPEASQELIAGHVPAGIVDNLELIEIQIADRVLTPGAVR